MPSLTQAPQVVVWNITSRCNLFCRHCYFSATQKKSPGELNTKEAMSFIGDMASLKIPTLLFSGGEPLLRKDIFELASVAHQKGVKIALSTNGTLITEETARKIKRAGFYYAGISLDGKKLTNDRFRKKKGAFDSSIRGIRNCKKAALKVGLRFTLTKYNLNDLPEIFSVVEEEKIPRLCIYHLVYAGRGKKMRDMDLNNAEKREALDFIWRKVLDFKQKGVNTEILTVDNHSDGVWLYLKIKKTNPKAGKAVLEMLKRQGGNSSGIRILAVDNVGDVYPDQFWRTRGLGNIRERKLSEILGEGQDKFLQDLTNRKILLQGRCQRCRYLEICNGNFRARAQAVSGDVWAEDPACYLTEKEISSL